MGKDLNIKDLEAFISGMGAKKLPTPLDLPLPVIKRIADNITPSSDPTPGIALDETQKQAYEKIIDWVKNPTIEKKTLTLGGFAGTGKSTLIKHVESYLKAIGLTHAVVALTGKAVSVLCSKGIKEARTCHSLIYTLDEKAKVNGKLKFQKKQRIDERLLIVDEASMIDSSIDDDLNSYPQLRILYVGDHGQLEPIGENPNLMKNPDLRLEVPHRQALSSNILQFAHAIRENKPIRYGKCPGVEVATPQRFWDVFADPQWDQIIVGFNKTRHWVNKRIRENRGHFGRTPDPGEKVIILNNNSELGLFNGMILTVDEAYRDGNGFIIANLSDPSKTSKISKWRKVATIEDQYGNNKLDLKGWVANAVINQGAMLVDYAYSITCHKAQGSQWDNVLVMEEVHPDWTPSRWSYTAITRAASKIVYCKNLS
jgi:exodeoxyribonuclease-5